MSSLNPEHLIEQAERLIVAPPHGPPRQVDLRRAISSAYYGVFHFINAAVANELVGAIHQQSGRYQLVYRSVDHSALALVCGDLIKPSPPQRYLDCLPTSGLGADIRTFSATTRELQQKRHQADYDPKPRIRTADARGAIELGYEAMTSFQRASEAERKLFLTLLVCPPRA